jgi:hypothetical protein
MTNKQANDIVEKLDKIIELLEKLGVNTNPPYLCPSVWINDYPQGGGDSGVWDGNNPYVTFCSCGCVPCMCTTTGEDAGEKV